MHCALCIAAAAAPPAAAAVPLLDTYYSPRNSERPVRSSTRFIILHTTEGPARGSGSKLQKNGEAHYMVDEAGRIYRIIDRKRVAYHCGRSMWNGLASLDNYSVGIEVVGYHNKDLTAAQYKALKSLLAELKKAYKVPDDRVLTHSMVAYGAPNQWHKRSHRGRKRCGMRMALPSVRRKLGLNSKPAYDPDVKAGRLVVADKALQQVLYSVDKKGSRKKPEKKKAEKPAEKPAAKKPEKAPVKPPEKERPVIAAAASKAREARKNPNAGKAPAPSPLLAPLPAPQPAPVDPNPAELDEADAVRAYDAREAAGGNVVGKGKSAWDIARDAYAAETTIYEFPNGERKKGSEITKWNAIPPGTRVIVAEGDVNEPEKIASLGAAARGGAAATSEFKPRDTGTASTAPPPVAAALVAIAGAEWNSERTIYVTEKGLCIKGSELDADRIALLTPETRVFSGYKLGGPISAKNPAFKICGPVWRDEGTMFLYPGGKMESGDKVDPKKIPPKTMILYKD